MVLHSTVIHLVATSKVPLLPLLSRALSTASVRWWTTVPLVAAMRAGDLLVIDLLDGGLLLQPADVARLSTRGRAFLVTGTNRIAPEWLEISGHERVQVLRCPGCPASERFINLVAAIEAEIRGPAGDQIATYVLNREPRFAAVRDLVRVICERPWETRRPVALAALTKTRLPALRHALGGLGFRRVEHFMVAVRLIAFEEIVSRHRVPAQRIRRMVGLIDPANVRRQLQRARAGSPGAFRDLAVSGA